MLIKNIPKKIILASGSPRRKKLLQEMGLSFDTKPVDIDETNYKKLSPEKLAISLAERKAKHNADNNYDKLIIGADTIVILDNMIMGKPIDEEDARKMLRQLSGKSHLVITGVSLCLKGRCKSFSEKTKVFFKELSEEEIVKYIQSKEPLDKAGAYGIQGLGRLFIPRIDGCYFNVVGFPVHRFYDELNKFLGEINASV